MGRKDLVVRHDDHVGVGRGLHRVLTGQRRQVGQRQRIDHRQEFQRPARFCGQRRDELADRRVQSLAVRARRVELDPRQHVVELQRRDRIGRALVGIDGDDQPHRAADGQLVDQRRGQMVEQVRIVDDQQQPVGDRLARSLQHGRRLAVVGCADQIAHRRERHDTIRNRPRHPGRGAADALRRRTGNRRLSRHRPAR